LIFSSYVGFREGSLQLPFYQKGMDTPPKFSIEPENDGLEDDVPFPRDVFSGSMLNFRGVFHLTIH